jgi:NAD(P)H dehydrogenase (quinone)
VLLSRHDRDEHRPVHLVEDHGMTPPPRIAVAGGTGRVGSKLVAHLLDGGATVRVLTRDGRAAVARFAQAEVAEITYSRPESLAAACVGVDTLYIGLGSSPDQVDSEIALIDAAVEAGVPHLVKLSSMGGPSRLHPLDWHALIEAHLAQQLLGFTVLRATTFIDVLALAGPAVQAGTWGGAAGDGRVNLIDTADVAAVAAHELLDVADPSAQRSRHLTGSRTWSMPEIADELSRQLGRQVNYAPRTPDEHRAVLVESGMPRARADILVGLDRLFHDSALADTTATVEDLLGHPPMTVPDWLTGHLELYR